MAHRAATDEICVTGGMGNAPSSKRRGLVRVSACCLLAPKDLACQRYGCSLCNCSVPKSRSRWIAFLANIIEGGFRLGSLIMFRYN